MHFNVKSYPLLLCLLALSGCASVTGSTNQSVSIQTRDETGNEVSGAKCDLTNKKGTWFVTTPGSVSIHRSNDDLQVLCKKDGLENGRAAVVSDIKGSMFGNIILGGGIGAIIDHSNGAAYEYPTLVQVLMGAFSKIETPKSDQPVTQTPMTGVSSAQAPAKNTEATTVIIDKPRQQLVSTEEKKLKELKQLYDQGLITQDVYVERQRIILEKTN